jgi:sarcosine oxidase
LGTRDLIVMGLGAMGSACAYQAARRGADVLGIDQYSPPHEAGSTLGDSRITRLALGEGEHFCRFVKRSHEIWPEVEREAGEELFTANGGLIISSPQTGTAKGSFFRQTIAAADQHKIAYEKLGAAEISRRYPQFKIDDDAFAYFEPTAGFVRPEACIRGQLALAQKYGAEIRKNEAVNRIESSPSRVRVFTGNGEYEAKKLVITAGAWLPQYLPRPYAALFTVYRQVQYWFEIGGDASAFRPDRFPIFIWDVGAQAHRFYGFPILGDSREGLKVATEQFETATTPYTVSREVFQAEKDAMLAMASARIPGLGPGCVKAKTCLYTETPDHGFVIDEHPELEHVIVASPCAGHGFKHSAGIGELLAQVVLEGAALPTPEKFGFGRFAV